MSLPTVRPLIICEMLQHHLCYLGDRGHCPPVFLEKHRSLICLLNELHVGLEEKYAVSILLNSFSNLGAAGGFPIMMAEFN